MNIKKAGITLVSDVAQDFLELDISRADLEISEQKTIQGIIQGIENCGVSCVHVEDPSKIIQKQTNNPKNVVLSIWSGVRNRNRRALVPSICETFKIRYIGADPYAAIITGDKDLSKNVCSEFNMAAPKGLLVRNENQIERVKCLNFPLVIKPLMEGGSIGIDQSSKVTEYENAKNQIKKLLKYFDQPIICEEFIPGREVSFCITGSDSIVHCEAVEVIMDNDPNYFNHNVFSMEDKRLSDRQEKQNFVNVSDQIPKKTFDCAKNIFSSLGKVDYMRIDGKFHDDFYCLELSTDPSISTVSLFAHSYYSIGKRYEDMICDILSTQLPNVGGDTL